ncbi:MAG: endolytic transglycosylase MltG [Oscillospiraceae bacterium]|nr:endolytic transglycosylase MltG [Oscillospiraceae bacterium]
MDNKDFDQLGFPESDENNDDFSATRELDSIHDAEQQEDFSGGIAPRERFTELNSADDPGSTRMMDSLTLPDDEVETYTSPNPVRKRKKRKKKKHYTNHTRTMGHIFLGVVLSAAAICVGIFLAWKVIVALMDYTGMAKRNHEADIVIDSSMNIDDIAETLHENGIIEMPWLFKTYINFADKAEGFLDGEYTVNSGMSYSNIITLLQTRRSYTNTVTIMIPEGYNAHQIGALLEENLVCRAEDFEKYYRTKLDKYDFEEQIEVTDERFYALEGYLFPDTYNFYVIDDLPDKPDMDTTEYAKQAAEKMYSNFENKITKDMYARAKELGMTFDQVITLASIIQKEGTNEDNMANISSVFHNRLGNMYEYPHLQSDTTEYYIQDCIMPKIPANSSGLYENIINAYDTYTCEGLPAGPICSPGLEAINAALYPAETDYYYFLSSSDGVFYFASTIEKHEQNIIDAALREEE